MKRLPVPLSDAAYAELRVRAERERRSMGVEAALILEAALGAREDEPSIRGTTVPSRAPSADILLRRQAREVYDYWREKRGKTAAIYDKPLATRTGKTKARLKRFSVEELKRAIDGVALDPWEDRHLHDDLTIIFRNDAQVEKFLDLADRRAVMNGTTKKTGWRLVRGSHGSTHVRDVDGTDRPPQW